jgi:hypothetical protein
MGTVLDLPPHANTIPITGYPHVSATHSHVCTHGLSCTSNAFSPLPAVTHLLSPPCHCHLKLSNLSQFSHMPSPTPHHLACITLSPPSLACNPSHLVLSHHHHLEPAHTVLSPLWYVFPPTSCHLAHTIPLTTAITAIMLPSLWLSPSLLCTSPLHCVMHMGLLSLLSCHLSHAWGNRYLLYYIVTGV